MKADLTNLTQGLSVGTVAVGEAGLLLSRFGAGEAQISGALRATGILRGVGGILPGSFTTTARDSIAAGFRPPGMTIFNTTTNQWEWNAGTDAAPSWRPMGVDPSGTLTLSGAVSAVNFTAENADTNQVITVKRSGDTQNRFQINAIGTQAWGPGGSTAPDVTLYRYAAGYLASTGGIFATKLASQFAGANQILLETDGHIYFGSGSDTSIFRGGTNLLLSDATIGTPKDIVANRGVANQIWLNADGSIYFGSAADTRLYRLSAAALRTNSSFYIDGGAVVDNSANGNKLYFGNTGDTFLYRSTTATLKTDGTFIAGAQVYSQPAGTGTGFLYNPAANGGAAFYSAIGAEANARFRFSSDGTLAWGIGGATATDTSLSRVGAGVLALGNSAQAGTLRIYGAAAGGGVFASYVTTDANGRFVLNADGKISWGPGSAVSDTTLYRSGVGVLTTDTRLQVSGMDVQRSPYGNQRHIESGSSALSGINAFGGNTVTATISFTSAYSAAPRVAISQVGPSTGGLNAWVSGVSTTGFTINVVNNAGGDGQSVTVHWIAEGQG